MVPGESNTIAPNLRGLREQKSPISLAKPLETPGAPGRTAASRIRRLLISTCKGEIVITLRLAMIGVVDVGSPGVDLLLLPRSPR